MFKCDYRRKCEGFTSESMYCTSWWECQNCGIWKRFSRGEIKQYKKVID
ncbi:MAG: hypothetical protein M0R51_09570 [Clostridia bacterium]|jgi:hypothetical protein|nr:hypothetical protein [Clostridia bacterium]